MILALMDALNIPHAIIVGHDTGGGVALMIPMWAGKENQDLRDFLLEGFNAGNSRKDRLTFDFAEGIVSPYITDQGKISLIRNASGLNTSHTTMLMSRHKQVKAKTLLVWGADDPWQRITDGERLAQEIPDATLIPIVNASHWITQDAPQEWLQHVLEFVQQ